MQLLTKQSLDHYHIDEDMCSNRIIGNRWPDTICLCRRIVYRAATFKAGSIRLLQLFALYLAYTAEQYRS